MIGITPLIGVNDQADEVFNPADATQVANFASRYFGTSSGGFFCKFPMPFRKGFRVELENVDPELDTDVFCNILYQLAPLPQDIGYFHAQFNTAFNPGPATVEIAQAQGRKLQRDEVGCRPGQTAVALLRRAALQPPEAGVHGEPCRRQRPQQRIVRDRPRSAVRFAGLLHHDYLTVLTGTPRG